MVVWVGIADAVALGVLAVLVATLEQLWAASVGGPESQQDSGNN